MKKGRHRRFEEARALKRSLEVIVEPCPECGADPEDEHASWCLATEDDEDGVAEVDGLVDEHGPVDEHGLIEKDGLSERDDALPSDGGAAPVA